MASWLRRGALSGAVSLSLGPLMLVGAAGSAHAFDGTNLNPPKVARLANGIPAPVAVPSSVIGSLDSATSLERARMVGNTVPSGVVAGRIPAGEGLSALQKGGQALAVPVVGLSIGWTIGSTAASLMGMDSSASLQELLGGEALAAAPSYVPNGDVTVTTPGWAPSDGFAGHWKKGVGGSDSASTFVAGIVAAPAYGALAGTITVRISALAAPSISSSNTGNMRWQLGCKDGGTSADFPFNLTGTDPGLTRTSTSNADWCASRQGFGWIRIRDDDSGVMATVAQWYPVGHASRPAETDPNPLRQWETRWTCSNASTGIAQSVAFSESDAKWPAMPKAECGSGLHVDTVEVWEVVPTNHNMDTRISSWTRSQSVKDWQDTYPECGDGSCLLDLQKVNGTTGTWTSCFQVPGPCAQWQTDPTKTDTYRCLYGTHDVALSECNVYTPTFDPATNVDTPFADPATGEVPDPGPPAPAPEDSAKCWPNGWGVFNPASWILMPIKCAFIPPAGTFEAGWAKVDIDWCSTAPGALSCAVGDVFGPFTHLGEGVDPEDCLGVGITVPNLLDRGKDGRMYPLSACSDAAKAVQAFWIPFATGAVYLGAIMLGARMVSKTIGADDAVPT